jgi:hypothetical protein
MTIGIGIKCSDGVVLCTDTQMTVSGSHKFYERKIFSIPLINRRGWVSLSYSGDPDLMNMFQGKFSPIVRSDIYNATVASILQTLEDVLNHMEAAIASSVAAGYGLYMLCGVTTENETPTLIKTSNQIVSVVDYYAYVGAGDSSLLRYLTTVLFPPPELSMRAANMLAVYLVTQAKAFVDGCGGDTDISTLLPGGRLHTRDQGIAYTYEQRLLAVQHALNTSIRSLCDEGRRKERFGADIEQFSKGLLDLCAY